MHTKDKLAEALRAADLPEMADKAAQGYYHDFLSPLDLPELQLDADLLAAGTPEAMALRRRHHNGEFDASAEESEAWAASPEGQDTMRGLDQKAMSKHRVVVCGGRNFNNRALLFHTLDALHAEHEFRDLMQGGARGADSLAREWALEHPEVCHWQINAEWSKFGNSAGPIRNKRMLDWAPDLVIAFTGGTGTANMVQQARAAGREVMEIPDG